MPPQSLIAPIPIATLQTVLAKSANTLGMILTTLFSTNEVMITSPSLPSLKEKYMIYVSNIFQKTKHQDLIKFPIPF
jgi:hypothetical protein